MHTVLVILVLVAFPYEVMLQQNGVEDPYPLDATIEYESRKKLPKPIIATENNPSEKDSTYNYDDPDDTRYNMKDDMPEYNLETKADFQSNKEAADWLMHDPNRYNVMPNKDSKAFFADGEDLDNPTNDDPIRLDKQIQDSHKDDNYAKDTDSKNDNLPGDDVLSDADQKIINSAYSLDEYDNENEFGMGNKHDGLDTKESFSSKIPDNERPGKNDKDEPAIKITDGDVDNSQDESSTSAKDETGGKEDEKEEEPRIKVTNDNDGISNQDTHPTSDSDTPKLEKSQKENSENNKNEDTNSQDKEKEAHDQPHIDKNHNSITVYRLKHVHKDRSRKLKKTKPLSESGTSRQHVLLNSNPVATEDPLEMTERMNSFENMMMARNEEERMARLYNFPHQTHQHLNELHAEATPQDPVEGEDRHGIPSKYGDWNGWSRCSATCSQGTQIRARMCVALPCESRDLYQTRTCIRNICPGTTVQTRVRKLMANL